MKGHNPSKTRTCPSTRSAFLFYPIRYWMPYLTAPIRKSQRIMITKYPRRKTLNPTRTAMTFWLNCMVAPHGLNRQHLFNSSNPYAKLTSVVTSQIGRSPRRRYNHTGLDSKEYVERFPASHSVERCSN
jgi:hypothetical protein